MTKNGVIGKPTPFKSKTNRIHMASKDSKVVTKPKYPNSAVLGNQGDITYLLIPPIGMYLQGFEKRVLPNINKRSSLGERWDQAET